MTEGISTALPVEKGVTTKAEVSHYNLTRTIDGVLEGLEQAARGEGRIIDPGTLPVDDDEDE